MTLILLASALGLAFGLLTGGRLANAQDKQIRFGGTLLMLVLAQNVIPLALGMFAYVRPEILIWTLWTPLAGCACVIAGWNWRTPGMTLVCVGILLNVSVVALNGGMPVAIHNLTPVLQAGAEASIARSWLHLPMDSATRLPFLADVIPIPGPPGLRGMGSLGDLVLALGAALAIWWFLSDTTNEAAG